ncbi:nitroreductase family protein [Leucobacter luti]|uniref:nitroreductase family protein n=1 Tax=Leucobacter luti TaxID=340320 RepID=UPI001C68AD1F|nr:nitroreductase family protein [Leucobacter luti]QYM74757.1 nitroreductase family protein [Leucobacter luti]
MSPRTAQTSAPVLDTLAERWSPRAFDADHTLPANALRGVFEAARWAPSASNTQPWRFILARRGTENFAKIEDTLAGFNRAWAGSAAALVVNVAEVTNAAGDAQPWAEYDLGQAVAHLSVQAHAEGLFVHQMGGFDRDAISAAFGIDPRFRPISVMVIGALGSADQLPEPLREREVAPRSRIELEELFFARD